MSDGEAILRWLAERAGYRASIHVDIVGRRGRFTVTVEIDDITDIEHRINP